MHNALFSVVIISLALTLRVCADIGPPVPACANQCLKPVVGSLCPGVQEEQQRKLQDCLCPAKASEELRRRIHPCLKSNCDDAGIRETLKFTRSRCNNWPGPESPKPGPGGGLSSGASAGIGVGVAVVIVIILALFGGWIYVRRRNNRQQNDIQRPVSQTDNMIDIFADGNDMARAELGDAGGIANRHEKDDDRPPLYQGSKTPAAELGSKTPAELASPDRPKGRPISFQGLYELPAGSEPQAESGLNQRLEPHAEPHAEPESNTEPTEPGLELDSPSTAVEEGGTGSVHAVS